MARHVSTAPLTARNAAEAIEIARLGEDYPGPVQTIIFSPDGSLLACSTYDSLYVWDVPRRRLIFEREMPAQGLAFSADNKTLAVAGRDIIFLDIPGGEQQAVLKGHAQGTTCIAFSPDGTLLASGGLDGLVRLGNMQTRRLAGRFEHPAPVRALAFSPDGAVVAAISWGTDSDPKQVYVWDVVSGEERITFVCTREKNLTFSPDGAWLAVDGKVYDIAGQRVIYTLNERQAVFSPDSSLIATCHNNFTTIGLWDAASGDKLTVLRGHGDPVWCITINATGTLLASGSGSLSTGALLRGEADAASGDRSVRLWGVPASEIKAEPEPPRERKPLKRLGEEEPEVKEDNPLKPVQDWLNKLSR